MCHHFHFHLWTSRLLEKSKGFLSCRSVGSERFDDDFAFLMSYGRRYSGMASLNCPLSIDVFERELCPGPWTFHDLTLKNCFDTLLLIDQDQLFPMNSNAVSLLFQLGTILHRDKKLWYWERRKIPLWSIKVNISSRKAILPNIFNSQIFCALSNLRLQIWKRPWKSLLPTTICFVLGEKCTFRPSHLSFRIIMFLTSFK